MWLRRACDFWNLPAATLGSGGTSLYLALGTCKRLLLFAAVCSVAVEIQWDDSELRVQSRHPGRGAEWSYCCGSPCSSSPLC